VSKQYQISYLLKAVDQATSTMQAVQKQIDELGKSYDKLNAKNTKLSKTKALSVDQIRKKEVEYTNFWKQELDKRANASKKIADQEAKRAKLSKTKALSIDQIRKKEVEYTNFWKQELDKRAKASEALAAKEIKTRERALSEKQKIEAREIRERERAVRRQQNLANKSQFKNRREVFDAANSARSAMFYAAAPATAAAIFSLKSTMDLEQQKLNLRTQFGGEEGNKAFAAMKEYAKQTAFSLPEAVQLLSDIKIGQENLGIKTNEELIDLTKSMGNIMIAFGKNKENRAEISNQLGQVAMAEKASTRQDLRVMQKRGLPVFQALKAYTGMSFGALQDKFGAELPSKLVIKSLEHLAKSPQVIRAMSEYSQTLTQAWGAFKEQTQYTAAAYGNILDKQFKIKEKLTETTNILSKFEDKMTGVDKTGLSITESAVGFGTAWVIAVPTLLYGALVLKKIHMSMVGAAGGATTFMKFGASINGIFGLWMLSTVDFKEMWDDINENGFGVAVNHLDKMLITFISIYSVAKAISALSIVGGAAAGVAAGAGGAAGAAGAAGVGGAGAATVGVLGASGALMGGAGSYFGTRWILNKANEAADYEMLKDLGFSQKEARYRAESSQSRIDKAIEKSKNDQEIAEKAAKIASDTKEIMNQINLQVSIDKDLNVTASTKTKRDPMQNEITNEMWGKKRQ
jgi:hypothetical protein